MFTREFKKKYFLLKHVYRRIKKNENISLKYRKKLSFYQNLKNNTLLFYGV
jgi:predicted DNA-binding protein YlxM (UPF0122 family)